MGKGGGKILGIQPVPHLFSKENMVEAQIKYKTIWSIYILSMVWSHIKVGHGKGQYVLTNQSHDIEYIPR